MTTAERIRKCILLEDMKKDKMSAERLGLKDKSIILSEPMKKDISRGYSYKWSSSGE